jgi:hypothetical protein
MAKKSKPVIIPEVDILKSGIERKDKYEDLRNEEDGKVHIGRSSTLDKVRKESLVKSIEEQENRLRELRESAKEVVGSKDDFKKVSKKLKKKDKKGKKKNKKKKEDSYMTDLVSAVPDDLAAYLNGNSEKKKDKKKKKKDKKSKIEGLTVKPKKKRISEKKMKKDPKVEDSEVFKRFKEVELLTKENMKDINETIDVVNERIDNITKSSDRVRGKDTALANYIMAKGSLISTKQKAVTDIMAARSKVYDIEMKKERTASAAATSDSDLLNKIFPTISLKNGSITQVEEFIGKSGKNKGSDKKKKKKNRKFYDDFEDNDLMSREKKLLKSGDIEYSPYEQNIEWEGKFNVAIKKAWKDGDWKFIAIDNDDNIIKDVPKSMFPSKKAVKMNFDDEKDVAIDRNTNKIYKVLPVPVL